MKTMLRLNHIDFHFFAMEDIVTTHGMTFMLRFATPLDAGFIRDAVLRLMDTYPRFRSVIVPTWFTYRLHLLAPDDPRTQILFLDAFHVRHGLAYETPEYYAFLRDFLNEPYSLEQGLPFKVRYLPESAVLLFSVHHMTCDAIWFATVMDALVAILNGERPPYHPAAYPSIMPRLLHRPFYRLLWQLVTSGITLLADLWQGRSQGTIPATTRPAPCHGAIDVLVHTLPYDLATLKARSQTLDCSITVLILSALALTVSRGPGRNLGNKISILVQADIKPYLGKKPLPIGNYVHSPHVLIPRNLWDQPEKIPAAIQQQLSCEIERMRSGKILFRFLVNKVFSFLGRKQYARLQCTLKSSRFLSNSCALSNIGNFDRFNTHGPLTVAESFLTSPAGCLFLVMSSMRNQCHVTFNYHEYEFTPAEISSFVQAFDHAFDELMHLPA